MISSSRVLGGKSRAPFWDAPRRTGREQQRKSNLPLIQKMILIEWTGDALTGFSSKQQEDPCNVYNFRTLPLHIVRSSTQKYPPAYPQSLIFLLFFYAVWPLGTLVHWFCFFLDDVLFPGHKTQPIEKPLFIVGNLRSGSTFLHRLLSRDSETFTSLTIWDIYLTPSVTQKKITQFFSRLDNKLGGHLHRWLHDFDRARWANSRSLHLVLQPEEDENILFHIWDSFWVSFLFLSWMNCQITGI